MKTPFFITGLPRSRTAWLANLFTTDTTLCFHEPRETILELMERSPDYRVGISDSMLILKFRALFERWPESPLVYVERDAAESKRSLIRFSAASGVRLLGREVDWLFAHHQQAKLDMLKHRGLTVVRYEQLDDEDTIRSLWKLLLGDVPFAGERWKLLVSLKVEQNLPRRMQERGMS